MNIHIEESVCARQCLSSEKAGLQGGIGMKFYTIKLPKFLGGVVRAMLNSFKKRVTPKKEKAPLSGAFSFFSFYKNR